MNRLRRSFLSLDFRIHGNDAGFTLIEVLIAAGLLSGILLLLYSTLFTAGRSYHAGHEKIDQNEQYRIATRFIRRQIEQLHPILWMGKEKRALAFLGEPGRLGFIAPLPAYRGGGGLHLQIITTGITEDDKPELRFYYRYADTGIMEFPTSPGSTMEMTPLLHEIGKLSFSYYGQKDLKQLPSWHDSWKNENRLPDLIRISFHADRQTKPLPDMYVKLRTQIQPGQPQFTIIEDKSA